MKTAHQITPNPQQNQDVSNKQYVDATAAGDAAVVFDDAVPANQLNIRSDRGSNQSPINNAQSQITNFGSQDGLVDPAAVGATAKGAVIGGGDDNTASGLYSTVPGGAGNKATGQYAFAAGLRALANKSGQIATAGGAFNVAGDAQTGWMVVRIGTPGVGAGESMELGAGNSSDQYILLDDDKAYTIVVSAVARGLVSGNPCMQSFRQTFAVRRESGTSIIAASGVLEQMGDAAANSWTLVASIGAGPDRFSLTVNTGITTSSVRVVAKVELTEVQNP